jgi:hypothetical protein
MCGISDFRSVTSIEIWHTDSKMRLRTPICHRRSSLKAHELLLFIFIAAAGEQSCLEKARSLPPDEAWLQQLQPRSRAMPVANRTDLLGASDWPGIGYGLDEPSNPWTAHQAPNWRGCTPDIVRYKVYKGKVYTDHEHYSKSIPSLYQRLVG